MGYDIADFCDVDPLFGNLAALDRLVAAAHDRGLRVLLRFPAPEAADGLGPPAGARPVSPAQETPDDGAQEGGDGLVPGRERVRPHRAGPPDPPPLADE